MQRPTGGTYGVTYLLLEIDNNNSFITHVSLSLSLEATAANLPETKGRGTHGPRKRRDQER